MNFNFGRTHYGEDFLKRHTTMEFEKAYEVCANKFRNRYWGAVSEESWSANKRAIREQKGIVEGKYVIDEGLAIQIVSKLDNERGTESIFLTQDDIANGELEAILKRIEERPAAKIRKKTMPSTIRWA
jgi:hypothetical protein